MELMQMEKFVAVVEERGVQKAADRVGRTQPAVSLSIAKLEREFGTPLLDRRRGRIDGRRLTSAGDVLYEYASRILSLRKEALAALEVETAATPGRLAIGLSESKSFTWVSQRTATFGRKCPGVRVEISCDDSDQLLLDLACRKIDLALLLAQPARNIVTTDLVVTQVGCGAGRMLWLVQCRVGRSHAVRMFEEILHSRKQGAKRVENRARLEKAGLDRTQRPLLPKSRSQLSRCRRVLLGSDVQCSSKIPKSCNGGKGRQL
jgi:molybdenum-dependent DNA-binding transcriptional regulator ModE